MSSQSTSHLARKQDNLINLIFVLVLTFAICIFFGRDVFADPDAGWHIKAGSIIWNNLAVPVYDTLTFTSDQQWYNLSWAWDVFVYWIFSAFGATGLYYFQAALLAISITIIYLAALSFKEFNPDTQAVITAICGLLIWDVLYLRPQLISYMLAISVLIIFSSRKHVYLVPIIVVLWANIHGSFIVVYTILFAFILEALHDKNYAWLKTLLLAAACSCLAPLINPIGYKIILGVARTLDSIITAYISEWMPFTFGREYAASMVVIILIVTGGFANEKIPVSYRVLAFLWLVAALISKRSFGFFGVLALPYLGYVLAPLIAKSPSKLKLNKISKLVLTTLLVALIIFSPILKREIPYFKGAVQKPPIEAINFINENCSHGRLFNDYNIGGYLALWLKDDIKYFIDGRAGTAFSEAFLKKYLNGDGDIEEVLAEFPVDAALISNEMTKQISYHKYFSSWKTIYKDDKVTMYQNRGSKICKRLIR